MKKIYALAIAAACCLGANAQDLYFTVNGVKVDNGASIDLTNDIEDQGNGFYQYVPHLYVVSTKTGTANLKIDNDHTTVAPELDADWVYGAEFSFSACAFGACKPIASGGILEETGTLNANDPFDMQAEFVLSLGEKEVLGNLNVDGKVIVTATMGSETATVTLTVKRDYAGVDGVEIDENAPAEYFDLQGRKIANPEKGLYIVRQGNKVSKVIR